MSPDDPLHLDRWFADGPPLTERTDREILGVLSRAVAAPPLAQPLAALRDLDFPLCVVERRAPGSYRRVAGLEELLIRLGAAADHIPRSCNDLYGPRNPTGERMRTVTGLPAEALLIEALRAGGVGLERVLHGLETIATGGDGIAEAAAGLAGAWDPMVHAAVRMARMMPLPTFSHDLIPWLVPIEIGGVTYRAPTGAQFSNSLIDWVLWGVEVAERDETYRDYALAFMAETPRRHRAVVARTLAATGGRALLDAPPAAAVPGLAALVKRIGYFRAVHQRFALETLDMRPGDVGSGLQAAPQFVPLLAYTRAARERLRQIRVTMPG